MIKSEIARELTHKIKALGYTVKVFSNGSFEPLGEESESYSEFSSCVLGFEKEASEIRDCFVGFSGLQKKTIELFPLLIRYLILGGQDLYFKIKVVDTLEVNSNYGFNTFLYIPIGVVTKFASKESRLFKYVSSVFYISELPAPTSEKKKVTKINDCVWIRKELKDVFITEFMEELQAELSQS